MKKFKFIPLTLALSLGLFSFALSSPFEKDFDKYHGKYRDSQVNSQKGDIDCDDMLAECGDRCNELHTWWWNKSKCKKKCIEEYNRCVEENY